MVDLIELATQVEQAHKCGNASFTLENGQTLVIETTPSGLEVLTFVADKDYEVFVSVHAKG